MAASSMQAAAVRPQLPIRNVTARPVKEPSSGRQYLLVSAASPNYSNFEATTQAIVESIQAG